MGTVQCVNGRTNPYTHTITLTNQQIIFYEDSEAYLNDNELPVNSCIFVFDLVIHRSLFVLCENSILSDANACKCVFMYDIVLY